MALPFLRGLFDEAVLQPIRLHVDANRYLCARGDGRSAARSTGPICQLIRSAASNCRAAFFRTPKRAFHAQPPATGAVSVRLWDDAANIKMRQRSAAALSVSARVIALQNNWVSRSDRRASSAKGFSMRFVCCPRYHDGRVHQRTIGMHEIAVRSGAEVRHGRGENRVGPLRRLFVDRWIRTTPLPTSTLRIRPARSANNRCFCSGPQRWCPPCNHSRQRSLTQDEFVESRARLCRCTSMATHRVAMPLASASMSAASNDGPADAGSNEVTRLEGRWSLRSNMQLLDHDFPVDHQRDSFWLSALAGSDFPPPVGACWRITRGNRRWSDRRRERGGADAAELAQICPPEHREASSRLLLQAPRRVATTKGDANTPIRQGRPHWRFHTSCLRGPSLYASITINWPSQ